MHEQCINAWWCRTTSHLPILAPGSLWIRVKWVTARPAARSLVPCSSQMNNRPKLLTRKQHTRVSILVKCQHQYYAKLLATRKAISAIDCVTPPRRVWLFGQSSVMVDAFPAVLNRRRIAVNFGARAALWGSAAQHMLSGGRVSERAWFTPPLNSIDEKLLMLHHYTSTYTPKSAIFLINWHCKVVVLFATYHLFYEFLWIDSRFELF